MRPKTVWKDKDGVELGAELELELVGDVESVENGSGNEDLILLDMLHDALGL